MFDDDDRIIRGEIHNFSSVKRANETKSWKEITQWLMQSIIETSITKEHVTIALSGGSSLDGWYAWCQESIREGERAFQKVRFCMIDERVVPLDSDDRNEKQILEKFIAPMVEKGVISPNQWISAGKCPYALDYTKAVGQIDIALVGIGTDGHIASLFPNHP